MNPEKLAELTNAQIRRLRMLSDVPEGGDRCRAFTGHGYASCIALVERGFAVEVGRHGLGAAFQITKAGQDALRSLSGKRSSTDGEGAR